MPSSSRIIGAESLSGVRRFTLSDLDLDPLPNADAAARPGLEDHPAFAAGVEAGRREGFEQAARIARDQAAREQAQLRAAAVEQLGARAERLAGALSARLAELEHSIADELVDLAIELARQTVRQAIASDRGAIVGVVQEAVSALIDERASFAVHLHPDDVVQVGDALADAFERRGGRIVPDGSVAAGGCRIVSAGSEIDATLATRWRRVLASIGREAPCVEASIDD